MEFLMFVYSVMKKRVYIMCAVCSVLMKKYSRYCTFKISHLFSRCIN